MKRKQLILFIGALLLSSGVLFSQGNTTTAGGEAFGIGGVSSYSVGQVVYTTVSGANGSVAQGVQQTYKVIAVGIDESIIDMELFAYPNPTTDYLTLQVEEDVVNLNYQLFDLQGNQLQKHEISNGSTQINMGGQPASTYLLKVLKGEQLIKTFEIIKL